MSALTIPKDIEARIQKELASLPAIHGKIILQIEFNCTMSKAIGSLKILKSTQEEVRPC